jgi:(E)-4-hydroxy-3-methylbut-2-enyl-diphosphate synthase
LSGNAVKTSLGLSPLLMEGIGDTLRFSLTGSLEEEVYSARALLRYLNLEDSVEVIACPTCGRCKWNVAQAAARISQAVSRFKSEGFPGSHGLRSKWSG